MRNLTPRSFLADEPRVPHTPDFLRSLVGSVNFMRLSFKERRTRRLVWCCVQETRGIALVFREIWDTTALYRRFLGPSHKRLRFAVSHISRKTSEIWGTRDSLQGQAWESNAG
jgi:hypothetical protein